MTVNTALLTIAAPEAERAIGTAQLLAAHRHLIPVGAANNSLFAAAKNLRRELAARFPRVKFAVAAFRSGRLWVIRARCRDFAREVSVALRQHTFSA